MKLNLGILILLIGQVFSFGQTKTEFETINKQIWKTFSEAYKTKDVALYKSIHSEEFIRINGNTKTIRNKKSYFAKFEKNWQQENPKLQIEFRFIERIVSEDKASEIGIYKLRIDDNGEETRYFYGKFHVILIKNEQWKILVDYDSDEFGTIGEDDFQKAFDINTY